MHEAIHVCMHEVAESQKRTLDPPGDEVTGFEPPNLDAGTLHRSPPQEQ